MVGVVGVSLAGLLDWGKEKRRKKKEKKKKKKKGRFVCRLSYGSSGMEGEYRRKKRAGEELFSQTHQSALGTNSRV